MRTDRYLKVILTVIAVELLWLGLKDGAPGVSAQTEPARVVIAGVEGGYLPVALEGQTVTAGQPPLQPIRLGISGIVKVEADRPLKIEADRPLLVESVPSPPSARPGE